MLESGWHVVISREIEEMKYRFKLFALFFLHQCLSPNFLLFGPFLLYLFFAPFFYRHHGHHFGPILFEFGPFRFGRAKPVMLI